MSADKIVRAAFENIRGEFTDDEMVAAILGSIESAGLVLVPREATEEMKTAGREQLRKDGLLPAYTDQGSFGGPPIMQHLLGACWSAMISASQAGKEG